jgi:hypothetical protein
MATMKDAFNTYRVSEVVTTPVFRKQSVNILKLIYEFVTFKIARKDLYPSRDL